MRPRILFTARDIGAAHQIQHIASYFKKTGFSVTVAASEPALTQLRRFGLYCRAFTVNGSASLPSSSSRTAIQSLKAAADRLIDATQPDALFCGLSSVGLGIDEACLYWASARRRALPSFQFLDTWGTFNHLEDGYPDLYFGIDAATARFARNARAPLRIVGSPKHFAYRSAPIPRWRNRMRTRLGLRTGEKLIGYFGQYPAVPGHWLNFAALAEAIGAYRKKSQREVRLLVRPHPAYLALYEPYFRHLRTRAIPYIDATGIAPVEHLLCACDIVSTCYSTVALDHAFLSCFAPRPIGATLLLLCGSPLKEHMLRQFGYYRLPLVDEGIGYSGESAQECSRLLRRLLEEPQVTQDYHKTTKRLYASDPRQRIQKLVTGLTGPSAHG